MKISFRGKVWTVMFVLLVIFWAVIAINVSAEVFK